MTIGLDQPVALPNSSQRRWWRVITALLLIAIFLQAVFAGATLSGFDWARQLHAANAGFVLAASLLASLVAIATLRPTANGTKLALMLLALAAAIFVQFALGRMTAKGDNLLWLHVPLGVAVVALASRAAATARQLGQEK